MFIRDFLNVNIKVNFGTIKNKLYIIKIKIACVTTIIICNKIKEEAMETIFTYIKISAEIT